jgi:hypothetical protein
MRISFIKWQLQRNNGKAHPETKIQHFKDSSTLEILVPYIEGIKYGESVEIDIDEAGVQLST